MDTHQLVVDFLNTVDIETGADLLDDPAGWQRWCDEHQVARDTRDQARRVRDGLRTVVAGGTWSDRSTLTLPVDLQPDGVRIGGQQAVQAVLAAAVAVSTTGGWSRLKLCPADDCRRAFWDRSHNRTRIWCEMSDCGNRAKARRYRARRGAPARTST